MGALVNQQGARHPLRARHRVGRDPRSDLHLVEGSVSSDHAVIAWSGAAWTVRDLSSRNGTVVNGAPLEPGRVMALSAGSQLVFGGGDPWRLESDAPPQAMAEDMVGGGLLVAEHGLLALPDPESPEVQIFRRGQGWVAERDGSEEPVADGACQVAGGRPWRLHLPSALAGTMGSQPVPLTLLELTLRFEVSLDEEHVRWGAVHGLQDIDLGSRSFNYTLLTLARARVDDAADPELPPSSHGWRDREELASVLRLDPESLRVQLFRARRQLARAGIEDAAALIERRTGAGQLRIGTGLLEIHRI